MREMEEVTLRRSIFSWRPGSKEGKREGGREGGRERRREGGKKPATCAIKLWTAKNQSPTL
jgi:hypothetical protein